MKPQVIFKEKVVIGKEKSIHNYFAWPSIARLRDGRIAVVCSGFRLRHICPFGKVCISFSDDECESFSKPVPVIDTALDDRDGGILPFGEGGVIVTSFNNSIQFQRQENSGDPYALAYLEKVTAEEEKNALGSEFVLSFDNCNSFSDIFHSPITSPHGPCELKDGTILWVGTAFKEGEYAPKEKQGVLCYKVNTDGSMEHVGEIPDNESLEFCEPYMIECDDGSLICHIRADRDFTLYQSESYDKGKTWSVPHPILEKNGGAPAHIIRHSSGVLISAYSYREYPYGIKVMFSHDNGKSWDTDYMIYKNKVSDDLGYPATIELKDGSLFTVFYAHKSEDEPAEILGIRWKIE